MTTAGGHGRWRDLADCLAPFVRHPRVGLRLTPALLRSTYGRAATTLDAEASQTIVLQWDYKIGGESTPATRLCDAAMRRRWTADDLPWALDFDPFRPDRRLFPIALSPNYGTPLWQGLDAAERQAVALASIASLLSQILHGEQVALVLAGQLLGATAAPDERRFSAIQVADEARHVEVFSRYLRTKIGRLTPPGRGLVAFAAAMVDVSDWDLKLLGMKILEGLALGIFAYVYKITAEPLLGAILANVIADEARHAEFAAIAIREHYEANPKLRIDREGWAFEIVSLMCERFLFLDVYDECFAHRTSRAEWIRQLRAQRARRLLTATVFRRVMDALNRAGLLTERTRPHYERLGVIVEGDAPAPVDDDLLAVSLS